MKENRKKLYNIYMLIEKKKNKEIFKIVMKKQNKKLLNNRSFVNVYIKVV
jgi:hypothetical protein